MSYVAALTVFHTAVSFLALFLGVPAIRALFGAPVPAFWTKFFIISALIVSITGYMFPFNGVTPAILTGVVALLVLAAMGVANFKFKLAGAWRWIYAAGMVVSVYLLAFVTIVQVFLKVPALYALSGTVPPSGPVFGATQLITLAFFGFIGTKAVKAFKPKA